MRFALEKRTSKDAKEQGRFRNQTFGRRIAVYFIPAIIILIMDLYFRDIKTTVVLLAESDELVYMLTNYDNMSIQERFYMQEEVDKRFRNTSLMGDHILDCIVIGNNGYQTNIPDRTELKENADILSCEWMKDYVNSPERGFYYTGAHIADPAAWIPGSFFRRL